MNSKIIFLSLAIVLAIVSCKKDEPEVSEEDLSITAQGAMQISTGVQTFVLSAMSEAAQDGFDGTVPSLDSKKKASGVKGVNDYSWRGPDADGWYTRSMSGTYDYYERIRFRDTIDYIMIISYDGADGSYENTTTTRFIKYTENQKVLYKGYSDWEIYSSGYSGTYDLEWKIKFDDWNPETSAGTYDWYWGVSQNSGGETVPYHRFEHLTATETTNGWLHCHVLFYDEGNIKIWDFEYDTPWVPVIMPELPDLK